MIPQFLCNSSIVAVTSHRYDNFHRQVQRRGDLFAKLKGDALKQLTKRLDKEQRDVRLCLLNYSYVSKEDIFEFCILFALVCDASG